MIASNGYITSGNSVHVRIFLLNSDLVHSHSEKKEIVLLEFFFLLWWLKSIPDKGQVIEKHYTYILKIWSYKIVKVL